MPRFSFFCALFIALITLAMPLYAAEEGKADDDRYTIKGVAVDVKAENSNAARDKAFMEGGRAAFKELARRLSGEDNFEAKKISDTQIGKLIKSFEVEKEKASGVRYIGTLTYHFKPEATADLFEKHNIGVDLATLDKPQQETTDESAQPQAPLMPEKTLVLPLVRAAGRTVLWEEKTSWSKAWENFVGPKTTPDLTLAFGDAQDVATIGATDALAGLRPQLQKIMQRYDAQNIVVASLLSKNIEPKAGDPISVQMARFDSQGLILETHTIDLNAPDKKPIADILKLGTKTAVNALRNAANKNKSFGIAGPHEAPPPATGSQMMMIRLAVPFTTPEEWGKKREALRLITGVSRIDITSLNRFRALAQLTYQGTTAQFQAEIKKRQMKLVDPPIADGSKILLNEDQPENNALPPSTPQAVFDTSYPHAAPAAASPAPVPSSEQQYEPMQTEPMPVE